MIHNLKKNPYEALPKIIEAVWLCLKLELSYWLMKPDYFPWFDSK